MITHDFSVHERDFLRILQFDIYGVTRPEIARNDDFRAQFGVYPNICVDIYMYILAKIQRGEIEHEYPGYSRGFKKIHILYGLRLMFAYETERRVIKFFWCSRDTFRQWSIFTVCQINLLCSHIVS